MPSDKEYQQTKRIKLGIEKMKAEFVALADWIDATFEVKTINIIYDTLYDKQPRLQICFEYQSEKNVFLTNDTSYFDKTKQKLIAEKFKQTIKQQNLNEPNSLLNLFKPKQKGKYNTSNVFVIYGAFEPVAKQEAAGKITTKLTDKFKESFNNPDIWTISIGFTYPTFFMFTDEKVKEYDTPEIRKIWSDKFYDLIKPFDEFNYFKRDEIEVYVDSKENFDNNYSSNWYYYYK